MDIVVSQLSRNIVQQPGVNAIASLLFTRGIGERIRLKFLSEADNYTAVQLGSGAIIHFGLKVAGHYEDEWLTQGARDTTSGTAWAYNSTGADLGFYTSELNCNTDELNALFMTPDGNLTNDVPSETVMTVLTWKIPGAELRAAHRLDVAVENMGDTGSEGEPTPATPTYEARIAALEGLPTLISGEDAQAGLLLPAAPNDGYSTASGATTMRDSGINSGGDVEVGNPAKGLVLASTTPASAKRFRISVNDSGTITATEI